MTAIITRRTNWGVLAMVFLLLFSIGLFAQSRPSAVSSSATPVARDLNATLAELTHVVPATNQDLNNLQHQGGHHWITFWRRDKAHSSRITAALRRNLQSAVPNLISDAQASGGSISTTFKLYKDLTVVCESLDSLLPPGSREGKAELTDLSTDLSNMNRLREELSSYIQQTAASIESKNPQLVSSAGRFPKRIIVDDIPDKPSPRKRRSSNQ